METDTRLVIGLILLVLSVIPVSIGIMINSTGGYGIVDYILLAFFIIIHLSGWYMIIDAFRKAGDKNARN